MRKEISITLPNGNRFYFHGSLDMVTSHFYNLGYYILDGSNSKIKCIIDAGANIGVETARFVAHYPSAQIISIEANTRNFNYLKKNFETNSNVRTLHVGLWPVKAKLKVESMSKDMQAFKVSKSTKGKELIDSITMSEILEEFNIEVIDILKLDIEGAELPLFTQGDRSWINKVNVFIIEIGDQDAEGMTQAIFRAINAHEYKAFLCGENIVLIRRHLDWTLERVFGFK